MQTKLKRVTTGLIALSLAGCTIGNNCRTEPRPIEYLFSIGQLTRHNPELDLKPPKVSKKCEFNKRVQTK